MDRLKKQVLLETKTLTQTSPGPTSATLSPKQRIIKLRTLQSAPIGMTRWAFQAVFARLKKAS